LSKTIRSTKTAALVTAVTASACCWLPLLLAGTGVGAAGVGAAFESLRPYLMVATALLLGAAFYVTYRRPAACAATDPCAPPRGRRITLWAVTLVAAASFTFPYASEAFLDVRARAEPPIATIAVRGMTCAACAVRVQEAVKRVPGVEDVAVTVVPPEVRVWSKQPLDVEAVRSAIRAAGYEPGEGAAARTAHIRVAGMVQRLGIT